MEFRDNSESTTSNGRVVEVCINDQWHEISSTTRVANNTQSPQDISIVLVITADSSSVTIEWSQGPRFESLLEIHKVVEQPRLLDSYTHFERCLSFRQLRKGHPVELLFLYLLQ